MTAISLLLHAAGFRPLVSVIPPDAPLSPNSRVRPDQRGKTPGRRNANGTWGGYAWLAHEPSEAEIRSWSDAGANIGLLAAHFPGLDIDTLDVALAREVEAIAKEVLGWAPCRTGRAPKRLLMYRTEAPFSRLAVILTYRGQRHLVEMLGAGRQYLIHGVHPSGARYTWDRPLTDLTPNNLTSVTLTDVERLFAALAERLDVLGVEVERVGDGAIRSRDMQPQRDLLAPTVEALREAVDLIPNSDDLFPNSRADYVRMGYAIRAAAGEPNEEDGFEVFASWAARCPDEGKRDRGAADDWRSDWRRMKPPYTVGWPWLAEMASSFGYNRTQHEFDPVESIKDQRADSDGPPGLSDQWLAEHVIDDVGDRLRYVAAQGKTYVWSGGRWSPDAVQLADHLVAGALRRQAALLLQRGATDSERKAAERAARDLCSANRLAAVRTLVRADPRCAAPIEAFDADPWLLNTPSGILDLRTGALGPHDATMMCARQTVATPDASVEAPEWHRFLDEATGGDVHLQAYLQRLAGYALTGLTSEQMTAFLWGPGGNGKSTFVNALQYALQDYAVTAPMDTFTATLNDRHPTDLAGLAGSRLVIASESQAGRKWDEQRLKAMTGGDVIRARFMRRDFFSFVPQFTLLFIGNHKPEITYLDEAIRRRIHMVPFIIQPRAIDHALPEKLRAEAPGVLAWAVKGCLHWQQVGLLPPAAVLAATEEYFEDEDAVGRFLEERCARLPKETTSLDALYRAWSQWSHARGEHPGTVRRLGQLLQSHGFERTKDLSTRRAAMRGLTLVPDSLEELL